MALVAGRVINRSDNVSKRALRFTPIYRHLQNMTVWIRVGAEGFEKTIPLDLSTWDTKVFSYKEDSKDGLYVATIGLEDASSEEDADDWKDVIITLRQFKETGNLLITVHYLMHYPGNGCKVWYKDQLIYNNETDDWRKAIQLPWE